VWEEQCQNNNMFILLFPKANNCFEKIQLKVKTDYVSENSIIMLSLINNPAVPKNPLNSITIIILQNKNILGGY
jgi:hypothetical protein